MQGAEPEGGLQVRPGADLGRRPGGDDRAGADQDHTVGQPSLVQVMRGQNGGHLGPLVDQVVDGPGRDQVEPGERFVQQQDLVGLRQTLGHEDALALSSGQLVQMPVGKVGELHPGQSVLHHGPILGAEPAPSSDRRIPAHPDCLTHCDRGDVRGRGTALEYVAHPP